MRRASPGQRDELIMRRNLRWANQKKNPPMVAMPRKSGQMTEGPAPRKRKAWGMLSRGVVPPDRICRGSRTRMASRPNYNMIRTKVAM